MFSVSIVVIQSLLNVRVFIAPKNLTTVRKERKVLNHISAVSLLFCGTNRTYSNWIGQ